MTIKLLLVDDDKIMREGLRIILQKRADIQIIAEADCGLTAVELACRLVPDVIVMDYSMPDMNGIEATRRIVEMVPSIKTIVISFYANERNVAEMLRAGVWGYVDKINILEELEKAIRTVTEQKKYFDPHVL